MARGHEPLMLEGGEEEVRAMSTFWAVIAIAFVVGTLLTVAFGTFKLFDAGRHQH